MKFYHNYSFDYVKDWKMFARFYYTDFKILWNNLWISFTFIHGMDKNLGNFCHDPYQSLAVKFRRFIELRTFGLAQILFHFILFMNKIFCSARISKLVNFHAVAEDNQLLTNIYTFTGHICTRPCWFTLSCWYYNYKCCISYNSMKKGCLYTVFVGLPWLNNLLKRPLII